MGISLAEFVRLIILHPGRPRWRDGDLFVALHDSVVSYFECETVTMVPSFLLHLSYDKTMRR